MPLALSGATLQAWFASSNISIVTIGLLTLVGQPYIYKFMWAPLLDRFLPPFLGRRRGWIAIMQICLAICFAIMAFSNPVSHTFGLSMLALLVASLSATQDIGIDAYRTDLLKPEERGLGAAYTSAGYRIAMVVSGGVALIIANYYGWKATYLMMSLLMILSLLVTIVSPEYENPITPKSLREAVIEPFREFCTRYPALLIILFIILYKIGDAFTVSLTSAFLIETLHFSLAVVGSINKILGFAASILGAIIGGYLLTRISLYFSLLWFGVSQALCSFFYMALAIVGKSLLLLSITVFADNFFSGLSGVAMIAFITGLCNKRYSATQFALFSAVSAIGRVFVGPFAAYTVKFIGWPHFFLISFFVSIPGLLLLMYLRNSYDAGLSNVSI